MSSSQLGHRNPSVVKALWERCIGGSGPVGWASSDPLDPLELHSLSRSLLLSLLRRLEPQVLIGAAATSAKGLMWGGCFVGETVACWGARGTAASAGASQAGAVLPKSASSAAAGGAPRPSR